MLRREYHSDFYLPGLASRGLQSPVRMTGTLATRYRRSSEPLKYSITVRWISVISVPIRQAMSGVLHKRVGVGHLIVRVWMKCGRCGIPAVGGRRGLHRNSGNRDGNWDRHRWGLNSGWWAGARRGTVVSWGASVGHRWTHGTTSHMSGSSGAGQVPYVTVSGLSCSHLKLKHNPWIKDQLQQRSNLRFLRCWSSISHSVTAGHCSELG